MPTAAIIGSAALGAAGSAYAANKQSSATKKAIKAQNALLGPYAEAGMGAIPQLQSFVDQGANFADTQAYKDITNSAKAAGMNLSGNRLTALTDYYATNFRPKRMSELAFLPTLGANAAGGQATNLGNLYQAQGAVQGSGIAGATNAIGGGLNSLAFLNMLNNQGGG